MLVAGSGGRTRCGDFGQRSPLVNIQKYSMEAEESVELVGGEDRRVWCDGSHLVCWHRAVW